MSIYASCSYFHLSNEVYALWNITNLIGAWRLPN